MSPIQSLRSLSCSKPKNIQRLRRAVIKSIGGPINVGVSSSSINSDCSASINTSPTLQASRFFKDPTLLSPSRINCCLTSPSWTSASSLGVKPILPGYIPGPKLMRVWAALTCTQTANSTSGLCWASTTTAVPKAQAKENNRGHVRHITGVVDQFSRSTA